MKWYSSDIKPEPGRWIIVCWGGDELNLVFDVVEFRVDDCGFINYRCWAYLDIEEFLNGKIIQKSDLPQYTGKRLISI